MNGGTRRQSVEKVGDSGRRPTMAMAGSSWAERMLSRPARGEGEGRSAVTLAVTRGVGSAVQQAGTKRSVEAAGIEAKGPRGTQGAIKPAGAEHDRWAAEEAMAERVRLAKLGGALGIEQRDEWEGGAMGAQAVVARLRERLRRRIMASWNLTRIGAALGWWNDFLATTRRVPFKALTTTSDLTASVYNNETLDLFIEYMRESGSKVPWRQGAVLSADYIASTAATIRLLRCGQAHYEIAPGAANTCRPAAFKSMRLEDGPLRARGVSTGFRAQDFAAIAGTFDRTSRRGVMEWAVGLGAHSMLLRGGEVGHMQRAAFDAARGITILSITEQMPCRSSRLLPWVTVDVTSIKDVHARHRPVPVPIRKRSSEGDEADPVCAYTAIMALYHVRCQEVPQCAGPCEWCKRPMGLIKPAGRPPTTCARANAPLFADADGKALNTAAVKALGKRMAEAAGLPVDTIAGRLWRIGGATDLRDTMGMAGAAMIKERGRWASDVAFIYARALVGQQMDAAAGMANAQDTSVEVAVPGWVQPAALR